MGRGAAVTSLEEDVEYEVITNQFIAAGNDGFPLGFLQRDESNKVLTDGDGSPIASRHSLQDALTVDEKTFSDQETVIQWIRQQNEAGQTVGRTVDERIVLNDACIN